MYPGNTPSKDKLKRIITCKTDIQEKLKTSAIQDKIVLYIILEKNGYPHPLHAGDVEQIYNQHPDKAYISIEPHSSFPVTQKCGWNQVWTNIDDEQALLEKETSTSIPAVLNYTTPLLEILHKAIVKFWLNYDPAYPPKSEEIVEWLKQQGIAQRNAMVIDTIIRPSHLKSGGNKSRKSLKG